MLIDEEDPTHYRPQTGDYLGELTNELYDKKAKQFRHIVEFASAGPKNYGYRLDNGKKECKVKGFNLNVEGVQQLNYDGLRNNVLDEIQCPQHDPITGQLTRRQYPVKRSNKIVRDVRHFELKTVQEEKNINLCLTNVWSILTPSTRIPTVMETWRRMPRWIWISTCCWTYEHS